MTSLATRWRWLRGLEMRLRRRWLLLKMQVGNAHGDTCWCKGTTDDAPNTSCKPGLNQVPPILVNKVLSIVAFGSLRMS